MGIIITIMNKKGEGRSRCIGFKRFEHLMAAGIGTAAVCIAKASNSEGVPIDTMKQVFHLELDKLIEEIKEESWKETSGKER